MFSFDLYHGDCVVIKGELKFPPLRIRSIMDVFPENCSGRHYAMLWQQVSALLDRFLAGRPKVKFLLFHPRFVVINIPRKSFLPFPVLKSEREFPENYAMLVEIKLNTSRRGRANMEKKFFIQFHSCWCGRHQVVISPFRIQSIYFT